MNDYGLDLTREVESILHKHLYPADEPMEQKQEERSCESPSPRNKRRVGNEELTSHRLIEKRRRDRMNGCLADLSRLIPSSYLKKGRGRIEKTEIVQMAIKYIRQLQQFESGVPSQTKKHSVNCDDVATQTLDSSRDSNEVSFTNFIAGYNDCFEETVQFIVENNDHSRTGDQVSNRLLGHLKQHLDEVVTKKGTPSPRYQDTSSSSSNSHQVANSDSDYCSVQSDSASTISDWSTNSLSSSSSTSTRNFKQSSKSLTSLKRHSFDQDNSDIPQEKSSMKVSSDDSKGQYKFKADMRDRFCFRQDSFGQHQIHHERKESEEDTTKEGEWAPTVPLYRRSSSSGKFPIDSNHGHSSSSNFDQDQNRVQTSHRRSNDRYWTKPKEVGFNRAYPSSAHCSFTCKSAKMNKNSDGSNPDPKLHPQTEMATVYGNLKQKTIPIFALHPNSTFYIPLVINFALLAPFISGPEQLRVTESQTLHPITISVNFCTKPLSDFPLFTPIKDSQRCCSQDDPRRMTDCFDVHQKDI